MLSEEERNKIEDAINIILRGNDIESSALILEKAIMDNYIITKGRVNMLKIATRQILNFIEEYKNKGSLDIIKEKVKANDKITKLQKENEKLNRLLKFSLDYRHKLEEDLYEGADNFIVPKQVVKDKIKEIEEDKECYYYDWFLEELDIEKTINILEKILGDDKYDG